MSKSGWIDDVRIVNPASFINLWKIPVFVRWVLRERFDTAILDVAVMAGTGAAAYLAH